MSSSSNPVKEEKEKSEAGTKIGESTEGQVKEPLTMIQIAEMLADLVRVVDPVSKKQREVLLNSLAGLYGLKVVHKDAFVTRKPHASGFEVAVNTKSGKTSNNGAKGGKNSKGGGKATPKKSTFDKKNPEWVKLQANIQRSSDTIASAEKGSPIRERFVTARKADVERAKELKKQLQQEQIENSKSS